ncbi:MAG: DUF3467 domain-containing protein [Candidatus Accumulibacter sp.]|uniref:DUF3467 domain-containing protein n=1 Tax=Candidatus Accumulibacter proximus TaxID=2954385 RepID=A0A935Q0A5_9PROT|nr:DUF3467 domain-containing protein [Candidatus Accumulibacter proximus]
MNKADRQENAVQTPAEGAAAPQMPRIRWVTDGLKSSYANFANANSTREEVVLNFGVNNSWDRAQPEMAIELSHRIMLSPFAAKRLSTMLAQLIAEYEQRYGQLN